MSNQMVTVICLCYNHALYVREALDSVLGQTHSSVQLILVDDASTDDSQKVIRDYIVENSLQETKDFKLLLNDKNEGNTVAFNKALAFAKGDYVIDLAADDVLLPERIEHGIGLFDRLGPEYGVVYSNVELIDQQGNHIANFYPEVRDFHPTGDLFSELIKHTFISPPGMMMRKEVLDRLDGYDTELSYEDYDFWVRSSRYFHYAYEDKVLLRKRELPTSHSKNFQNHRSEAMLNSTLAVCQKAVKMIRDDKEAEALAAGVRYYLRQSALLGHKALTVRFKDLLKEMEIVNVTDRFWTWAAHVPLKKVYLQYLRLGR